MNRRNVLDSDHTVGISRVVQLDEHGDPRPLARRERELCSIDGDTEAVVVAPHALSTAEVVRCGDVRVN